MKRSCAFVLTFVSVTALSAQSPDADLYGELRWRHIGPFRGGRTVGAAGVVQQPNVFYIGVNNGGVWKTTDYGLTWAAIFDDQPTQSIGAIRRRGRVRSRAESPGGSSGGRPRAATGEVTVVADTWA